MKKLQPFVLAILAHLMLSGATCRGPILHVVSEPEDTDNCPAACQNLRALGCSEGQPLPDGTSCERFCVETQINGMPLNPTCIMQITSCDEVDVCTQAR